MAHSGRCKNSQLYTEAGLGCENCKYRYDLNVQCQNSKSKKSENTRRQEDTEGQFELMLKDHELDSSQEMNHVKH